MLKRFLNLLLLLVVVSSGLVFPVQKISAKEAEISLMLNQSEDYDLDSLLIFFKDDPETPHKISVDFDSRDARPTVAALLDKNSDEYTGKKQKLRDKMSQYIDDEHIERVQPEYIYQLSSWSRPDTGDTPGDFDTTPALDTGNHWYYEKEHVRQMWQDQDCFNAGSACGGDSTVTVAVLDSGLAYETVTTGWQDDISKNPEFFNGSDINIYTNTAEINGNAAVNCFDNQDDDGNGIRNDCYGFNADIYDYCLPIPGEQDVPCTDELWRDEGLAYDDNGHGTFVTGLITSLVDNAAGSVSPAFKVRIMPLKTTDFHANTLGSAEIVYALDYAIDHGADVINMSISSATASDTAVQNKLTEARNAGIVLIAASGNASGGSSVGYPAALSTVMAVGALDTDGSRADYSNYGSELDVVAYVGEGSTEGQAVYQSSYTCFLTPDFDCFDGTDSYTSHTTGYGVGTSYAAPQVSALAALLLSVEPALTPAQVENFIRVYADENEAGSAGADNETGQGVIDFEATLNALTGNEAPTITVVDPSGGGDTASGDYDINWTDTDADDNATINVYIDTDTDMANGKILCANVAEDADGGANDRCTFNTRFYQNTNYYIYACINDFRETPICSISGVLAVANMVLRDSGKVAASTTFKQVNFTTVFTQTPIINARVTSDIGTEKVYVNVRNVTITGFEVQIQELVAAGYDGVHQPEEVSWYAIQNATADEQIGEVAVAQLNAGTWTQVNFWPVFSSTPIVLAIIRTDNGADVAYADIRNITTSGFQVRVEEPYPLDSFHTGETIAWIAFTSNSFALASGSASSNQNWTSVNFPSTYAQPPAVLIEINSENGTDRCAIDVRNVTTTGFEFRIEEDIKTGDGVHMTETVGWEALAFTYPTVQSGNNSIGYVWTDITFNQPLLTTPKIFAEVNSENGPDTVEVEIKALSHLRFQARIEEDLRAGWDGAHTNETIAWYATTAATTSGLQFGTSNQASTVGQNDWVTINFSPAFSGTPKVFADIQSQNGADTVAIDIRNVDADSFDMRLEEDKGAGWDGAHTTETIAWMAFETPPVGQAGTAAAGSPIVVNQWSTSGTSYPAFGSAPKILADINSEVGSNTINVDLRSITTTGFEVRVEEEPKKYDGVHQPETIVWFAWQ